MRRPGNGKRARVAVVIGCFPEGGDSIVSAFSWEPLPAKLQDNLRVSLASLLTKSHHGSTRMCMCIYGCTAE